MVRVAASTNGLRAKGKPIAGGARLQDGWSVGWAFALRPAGEIQVRTTLVDALSVRPRTRVRFPPPPLRRFEAKQCDKSCCAGEMPAQECEESPTEMWLFAAAADCSGRNRVAPEPPVGRMRPLGAPAARWERE